MASSDATPIAIKNQAYRVVFPIWDADGDVVTGATGLDSEISKDQGTFADCTNEATEIATASGIYYLDLTSTEMNADNVAIIIKTSTVGAKTTVLSIYPAEASDIKVNVVQINSVTAATPGASGGILISGTNSGTTTLGALTVTGATTCTGNVSMAAGLNITQSSSNTSALVITGNGTGHGASITSGSGATGDGVLLTAASTNGNALRGVGSGSGDGFHAQGGATGRGFHLIGGATSGDALFAETTSGHAFNLTATGTTKHGIHAAGGSTTSHGINAIGGGVGHGILATSGSGATGNGISAVSVATSGSGLNILGNGSSAGLKIVGQSGIDSSGIDSGMIVSGGTAGFNALGLSTGHGILATSGNGATGDGFRTVSASTNGNGFYVAGTGTGAGVITTGGATGNGLRIIGGGTSGAGINVTTTSGDGVSVAPTAGHALNLTANGTTKHGINATGGSTTSHGISATGGGVGHGILATSGAGATGDGIRATAASTNGNALNLIGVGTGAGLLSTGGATGPGISGVGGATSGSGLQASGDHGFRGIGTSNGMYLTGSGGLVCIADDSSGIYSVGGDGSAGITALGTGNGAGFQIAGGLTGIGINVAGGGTSGAGINVTTTSGDGISVTPTAGSALVLTGNGTSKHGAIITGGTAGTSDGLSCVAGTGGVPIRGNITGNITGNLSGSIGSLGTDAITSTSLATSAVDEIVDAVWDEPLTGATHNVATSAGRRLREGTDNIITSGTAQAGSMNTITLAAGASATDGTYDPSLVLITEGTGVGQARLITSYNGTTKVAVVDRDWRVTPDSSSVYEVLAYPNLMSTNEGLAQAGTATTITLNSSASATNDIYKGQTVVIRTGTGQDQSRIITAYNGTTKVATVAQAWVTNPTSASGYMILPTGRSLMVSAETDSITSASFASGTVVNANAIQISGSSTAADNSEYFWVGATLTGTATAGGASTITLAGGSSATDSYYNKAAITIVSGTGAGQTRQISAYVGATKVATVDTAWTTNPDNTSVYQIIGRIV